MVGIADTGRVQRAAEELERQWNANREHTPDTWRNVAAAVLAAADNAEAEVAAVRAELKACGHDHEGAPLHILVDRAIDKERTRIEEIRKAVAALEEHAQRIYTLPEFMRKKAADTINFREPGEFGEGATMVADKPARPSFVWTREMYAAFDMLPTKPRPNISALEALHKALNGAINWE